MNLNRTNILEILETNLKNNSHVFAFWLEGADASGTIDEYSDLDIWLDVQDGQEDAVFQTIEKILTKLSPLDFNYEQEQPHPLIRHKIFHLKNSSDFLLLDVCIQSHSRNFIFTQGLPGEEVKIIFDKQNVIQFQNFDEAAWQQQLSSRIHHLKNNFAQQSRVIKMIKRKSFIDAFNFYLKYVVQPLSELLRIKYAPRKQIFLKYLSQDLPHDIAEQLKDLYQVSSLEELELKVKKANTLFKQYDFFDNL